MIRITDDRLDGTAARLDLSADFIRGRLNVNSRRIEIISDLVKNRGMVLENARILEVGCHLGFGLLGFGNSECVGLEYFVENCKKADILAGTAIGSKVRFVNGTAAALPFDSSLFDFVISNHVIEHMPETIWELYIAEMSRVLKPGGLCQISFPQWHHPLEHHYGLPFLHWLPKSVRHYYARLTPRYRHIHDAVKTYEQTARDKNTELTFTELPKKARVITIAQKYFRGVEDITREFSSHGAIKALLGQPKHFLAVKLANTWICPERKLLLTKL